MQKTDPADWAAIAATADRAVPAITRWATNAVETARQQLDRTAAAELLTARYGPVHALSSVPFEKWFRTRHIGQRIGKADVGELEDLDDILARIIAAAAANTDIGSNAARLDPDSFTTTDPRVIAAAETRSAASVIGISEATRQAIRRAIGAGVAGRLGRSAVVDLITGVIGLTEPQATALANYTVRLEQVATGDLTPAALRRHHGLHRGSLRDLNASTRGQLVDRYRQRLLQHRATMIARTESMWAANSGRQAAYEQAIREGLVAPTAVKEWSVTWDDRLCPWCEPMDGAIVEVLGGAYQSTLVRRGAVTTVFYPPLHPLCRCTILLRTD